MAHSDRCAGGQAVATGIVGQGIGCHSQRLRITSIVHTDRHRIAVIHSKAVTPEIQNDAAILREAMRLFIGEQRRLLVLLLQRGTLTQAEFGRLLGLEKSWVSRSVDKLVALGWVARSTLASDRRNVQLQLTATGKVAARAVDARMSTHASEVLDRLPGSKRQRVVSALKELCAALQRPSLSSIDTGDQPLQDKKQ